MLIFSIRSPHVDTSISNKHVKALRSLSNLLRQRHPLTYALGGWTPEDAFQGISYHPKLKSKRRVTDKSP